MNATTLAMFALPALLGFVGSTSFAQTPSKPLSLHPQNPRYLLFRGKPTVLITSGEHYGAVLNLDFDYVPYLDELAKHKLNLTRTFSGTYLEHHQSFSITENTLAPKPGRFACPWLRVGDKYDLARYDDAYFARLKDFVGQAAKRGIVVEYVLFCTLYDDSLFAINPMNPANNTSGIGKVARTEVFTLKDKELTAIQDAFARKAVAELREFDNVYLEICNEPYWAGPSLEWQAHIAQTIAAAQKEHGSKLLIAQNIANGSQKVEKPDPLVSIFNFHYATPPDAVAENYALNKPIGDDETGFKGSDDFTYRYEAWEFLMAGGSIYSNLDYSFTPSHPSGDFTGYKSPGGGSRDLRAQLGILKQFMDGFDFTRMAPANDVIKGGTISASLAGNPASANVTVRVLAEKGKAYAAYVRGGTRVELLADLPAGAYRVEWVNTQTGEAKAQQIQHEGPRAKLTSPEYSQDIALRILRQ